MAKSTGSAGSDNLNGGSGDDVISAGAGDDKVSGGSGNDTIAGDAGNDRIGGGSGDDILDGGSGSDDVKGDSGDDILIYRLAENAGATDIYDGGSGYDTLRLVFTRAEWMSAQVQQDIANYLTFIRQQTNPVNGDASNVEFRFTAFDLRASKFEALEIVVDGIRIDPRDQAVTLVADAVTTTEDAASIGFDVLANDSVPDLIRSFTHGQPSHGTVTFDVRLTDPATPATATFVYTPDPLHWQYLAAGESATDSFTYTVVDADGDTQTATVTVTILGTNDAPIITSAAQSGAVDERDEPAEGGTLTAAGTITFSDVDLSDDHSASVTTRAVSASTLANGYALTADQIAALKNAFTIDATAPSAGGQGAVAWSYAIADGAIDYLGANDKVTLTFTVLVDDNEGATATQIVTITVTGTNDAPTITSGVQAGAVDEKAEPDEGGTLSTSGAIAFADVDLSDDPSALVATRNVTAATLSLTAAQAAALTGAFTIDATAPFGGGTGSVAWSFDIADNALDYLGATDSVTLTFTVTVDDGNGGTANQDVTITVTGTNDGPVAVADTAAGTENETLVIDVLANDTDVDTGALFTLVSATAPADKGNAAVVGNMLAFDPGSDFDHLKLGAIETVILAYTMTDENGAQSSSTVTLTITGTNDGPVAVADTGAGTENETLTVDVLANDTDVDDGATFTLLSAASPASKGVASVVANQLVFTPGADFDHLALGATEVVTVTYTMSDEHGATSSSTLTLTITGTNDGPVAVADTGAGTENETLTVDVLANDTDVDDGATFTLLSAASPASKGVASVVANQLVFTPGTDFDHLALGATEIVTVTYTMSDEHGATSSSTLTLTITGTNDGPVITSGAAEASGSVTEAGNLDDGTVVPGTGSVTNTLTATDVDAGSTRSWSGSANGVYGNFAISAAGVWTYTIDQARADVLNEGESFTETFTATVTDDQGATAVQQVTVLVNGTNDAPVASPITGAAVEDGGPILIAFAGDDKDGEDDAGSLTYTIVGQPSAGSATVVGSDLRFDPGTAFQDLAEGQTRQVTITYIATDARGATSGGGQVAGPLTTLAVYDYADITNTRSLTPDTVATGITASALTAVGALTGSPFSNHFYLGGWGATLDTSKYYETTLNAAGKAIDFEAVSFAMEKAGSGTATWFMRSSADGFTGNIATGTLANDIVTNFTVDLSSLAVAGAPITFRWYLTTTANATAGFANHQAGGLGAGIEIPGLDLSFTGKIISGSSGQTATITVTGVNDAPVAVDDTATVAEDGSVLINVLANDTDVDAGAVKSIKPGSVSATNGVATIVGGQIRFVPDANYNGPATIVYTVTDGSLEDVGTVAVTVTSVNDAPVAVADAAAGTENQTLTIDVLANDTDVDAGATRTLSSISAPAGKGSVSIVGNQLVFNPGTAFDRLALNQVEVVTLTYTMRDEFGATSTSTVTVTITGTNDAPVANADTASTNEDTAVTINPVANDTDVDGSGLIVSAVAATSAKGAAITLNPDGTVNYDPTASATLDALGRGQTTTDTFTYTVRDAAGAETVGTVTVTVTGRQPPVAVADTATTTEHGTASGNAVANDDVTGGTSATGNVLQNGSFENPAVAPNSVSYLVLPGWSSAAGTMEVWGTGFEGNIASHGGSFVELDNGGAQDAYSQTLTTQAGRTYTLQFDLAIRNGTAAATNQVEFLVNGASLGVFTPTTTTFGTFSASFVAQGNDVITFREPASANNGVGGLIDNLRISAPADVAVSAVNGSAALVGQTVAGSTGGTFVLGSDGAWTFAAGNDFDSLPQGGTRTSSIAYTVTDIGGSSTSTVTVTVTGENDAPVVTGAVTGIATEDGASSTLNALANASDVDAGTALNVVDVATLPAGVTYNAGARTFTLDPAHAAYQSLAAGQQQIVTATYAVSDGLASTAASVSWTVTGTNDAPTLSGVSSPLTFAENTVNATPQLIDAAVSFGDVDGNLGGGKLVVSGLLTEDRVGIAATGGITVSGSTVSYNGTAIGTMTGGTGATLTVQFNAAATVASTDALIQSLTYGNVSNAPTAQRTLVIDVFDGAGAHLPATFGEQTGANNPFASYNTQRSAASFADIDGDGDLEMVVGSATSGLAVFRNDGNGSFTQLTGAANPFASIGAGNLTTTAWADLNADGRADMVLGADNVPLRTFINNGNGTFTEAAGAANPFNGVNGGFDAAPTFIDYDGDGDQDMVLGDFFGGFRTFQNNNGVFTALTGTANPFNGLNVADSHSKPAAVDFDGDGDMDIVSGSRFSGLVSFRNNGNGTFTKLSAADNPYATVTTGQISAPAFADLNGDGIADAVFGSDNGTLRTFTSIAGAKVVVNVTAQNDAPVAVADTNAATEDTTVTGSVATNDSDPDAGAVLTYALNAAVPGLTLNSNGSYSFNAGNAAYQSLAQGQTQTVVANYTVSDQQGATAASTLSVTVTGANDAPTLAPGPNTSGAVSYYGGENNARDSVGTNHGDVAGVTYAPGHDGNAFNFTGSNSFTIANQIPANFTISGWIKTSANSLGGSQFYHGNGLVYADVGGLARDFGISILNNQLAFGTGGNFDSTITSTSIVTTGQWVNFAAVRNGSVISIYINGVLEAQADTTYAGLLNSPTRITVGANTVDGRYYNGQLDGLTVFDYAQSADEITQHSILGTANLSERSGTSGSAALNVAKASVVLNDVDLLDVHTTSLSTPTLAVSGGGTAPASLAAALVGAATTTLADSTGTGSGLVTVNFSAQDQLFDFLAVGQSLTVAYTVTVDDGKGGTATQLVRFIVNGTNDGPVAVADSASTSEDAILAINVLGNDSDVDGDTLSFTLPSTSTLGAALTIVNGQVRYDPTAAAQLQGLNGGQSATDSFTYTVSDGKGGTATAAVTVVVVGVTDPRAVNDTFATSEDNRLYFDVLANDVGNGKTIVGLNGAGVTGTTAQGAIIEIANGQIYYDPQNAAALQALATGQSAVDTFTYSMRDANGVVTSATVTVNVSGFTEGSIINSGVSAVMTFNSGSGQPLSYSEAGMTVQSLYPPGNSPHLHFSNVRGDGTMEMYNHSGCCSQPYEFRYFNPNNGDTTFSLQGFDHFAPSSGGSGGVWLSSKGGSITVAAGTTGWIDFSTNPDFQDVEWVRWEGISAGNDYIDNFTFTA